MDYKEFIDGLRLLRFKVPQDLIPLVEAQFFQCTPTFENTYWLNEFRVANAEKLPKTRPQVLIGSRLLHHFPSMQSWPLLHVADVVCVTSVLNPPNHHSVINLPPSAPFSEILKRLPPGFNPDFYWDFQTEYLRPIHRGMEEAPFPTVASVCHIFYTLAIEAIYSLYDRVLPINPFFSAQMAKKFPGKNIDIPFGLNWASFNYLFKPNFTDKKWDLCLSFGPKEDAPHMERRRQVVEWTEAFMKKHWHRYKICIGYNLRSDQYQDLLNKSRISINVVGVNGPYNYRTFESIAQGAMVFHYDWNDGYFTNTFDGLLKDGVHGVSFTKENFEEKLLYYLEHKDEVEKIARQAWQFADENYSYEKLFLKLIDEMKKVQVPAKREVINPVERIYLYQLNPKTTLFVQPGHVDIPWIQANNEMVIRQKEAEIEEVPANYRWIVEWNRFMICKESGKPYDTTLLKELLEQEVVPFDEERILFKFDIKEVKTFFLFNLELLKVIDNPLARAKLYQQYCRSFVALPSAC